MSCNTFSQDSCFTSRLLNTSSSNHMYSKHRIPKPPSWSLFANHNSTSWHQLWYHMCHWFFTSKCTNCVSPMCESPSCPRGIKDNEYQLCWRSATVNRLHWMKHDETTWNNLSWLNWSVWISQIGDPQKGWKVKCFAYKNVTTINNLPETVCFWLGFRTLDTETDLLGADSAEFQRWILFLSDHSHGAFFLWLLPWQKIIGYPNQMVYVTPAH